MSKVYLITGAGHFPGIGSCSAEHLLITGQCVVINSQNIDSRWDELKNQYPDNLRIVKGDITDSIVQDKFISEAITTWGRIDTLISNAAKSTSKTPDRDEWNEEFLLNVIVPYELATKCTKYLNETKGSIVLIGSRSGVMSAPKNVDNDIAYGIAKSATHQLGKYLSVLLCPNIRVNVVIPGMIITSRHDIRFTVDEKNAMKQRFINDALIEDIVDMDDIIDSIVFLSNNSSITGQLLPVCNGSTVHKKGLVI